MRVRFPAACLLTALLAMPLAACSYPDTALTPPPAEVPASTAAAPEADSDFGLGTPFVVIRFGPEPVDFAPALTDAVTAALAQRPEARFHLLTVRAGGGPERPRPAPLHHTEAVLRSLAEIGVPPDRVFVAAATAPEALIDEVRLYLR